MSEDRVPLDFLAEQFLREHRASGVDPEAFAAAHPEHESELRELLPTLVQLEGLKRERESSTASGRTRVALPRLERLGDFRIVREVGRGGMGVVFEAVQESLGRRVALKVLPHSPLLTGNQLERFQREARTAAALHHGNIVPVFGSGESDGYHWYAMQFIDGASLETWRREHERDLPPDDAAWREHARAVASAGAQAAAALHHAHRQGTLHRDVKPANLILDRQDRLWVTDFGLAKSLEAAGLTVSGDVVGTPQYMAPEQFAGSYDERSEVYALGVTLYELLALEPAFRGRTRTELMERIRTTRPAPLRRVRPAIPEDLAVVVERAIAADPRDRYPDADAFRADLQAFVEGREVAARPLPPLLRFRRWCARNRAVAALGASTFLAAIGAAIVGWVAYVVTDDALEKARVAGGREAEAASRAESNQRLALRAFADVFDSLVGRDPALLFEGTGGEDGADGEDGAAEFAAPRTVDPNDVALLQRMLAFYDQFAEQNGNSGQLRLETARAHRRVGAIHARLGAIDAAATAYEEARRRFAEINDRDVTRELAGVHVDLGQIHLLGPRPAAGAVAAVGQFRTALALLEKDAAGGKAVRFDRAQAHYLLAFAAARGPARAVDERRDPRRSVDAAAELRSALALLDGLLAESPGEPEFRGLKARCLLLSARLPSAAGGDGSESFAAAVAILRDLVAKDAAADRWRHELCKALLDDAQRRAAAQQPWDVAAVREALGHAELLVRRQPGHLEYRLERVRAGRTLGLALARADQREAAAAELRRTVSAAAPPDGGAPDPRLAAAAGASRIALVRVLLDDGKQSEARSEAQSLATTVLKAVQERRGPYVLREARVLPDLLERVGLPEQARALRQALPSDRPADRPRGR